MKNRIKKFLIIALIASLFCGTFLAGRIGLGCDFKGSLVMCGTKDALLDGCYVESSNG